MAKILVIDDEQGVRNLLDRILSQKGYEVMLADGGRKGLELYHREHPHAVVLDLMMPEMNGLTVLREIRNVDQKTPVILLSGTSILETTHKLRAVGVTEFVEKEFSLHFLLDSLKRHLKTTGTVI